jgi:hypothetical protein
VISRPLTQKRIMNARFGTGIVVTAYDIQQSLIQDDATAASIDQGVQACAGLDATTKAEWTTFYTGYQAFSTANKNLSWFTLGLPNIGDQVVSYETQLQAWSTKLAAASCVMAPTAAPAHGTATDVSWLDKNRGIITGALILAGLIAARPYVLPFIALIPAFQKRAEERKSHNVKVSPKG